MELLVELREIRESARGGLRGGQGFENAARDYLAANDTPPNAKDPAMRALIESLADRASLVLDPHLRMDPLPSVGVFLEQFGRDADRVLDFIEEFKGVHASDGLNRRSFFLNLVAMIDTVVRQRENIKLTRNEEEKGRLTVACIDSCEALCNAAEEGLSVHKDLTPREMRALLDTATRIRHSSENLPTVELDDLRERFENFAAPH